MIIMYYLNERVYIAGRWHLHINHLPYVTYTRFML